MIGRKRLKRGQTREREADVEIEGKIETEIEVSGESKS